MMTRTALITGASFGIGRELARTFAENGHDLVLVARSSDALAKLKDEIERDFKRSVVFYTEDLAKAGAAERLHDKVVADKISISILVNNAGFGLKGAFLDLPLERQSEMIQLNVVALVELCHVFGKGQLRENRGAILNVASTAAFQPGPFMNVYYATKAFVLSFSEALDFELRGTGVTVTALCPGPTDSEFFKVAAMGNTKLANMKNMASSKDVAQFAYKQTNRGRPIAIPGLINKIGATFAPLMPRALILRIAASLQK